MLQTCYQHNQRQHDFELKGLFLKPYWKVKSINVGQDKRCDTALTAGVGDKMQKKVRNEKTKVQGIAYGPFGNVILNVTVIAESVD